MFKLFRANQVVLGPIDIIAQDRHHAAQILECALRDGLERHPGATFSLSEWSAQRVRRYHRLQRWAHEEYAGVIWPAHSSDDWDHISYDLDDQ